MSKNNFSRTNVDVSALEVSAPNRSSFDLSKNDLYSIPFGKLVPLRASKILHSDTLTGSVNPQLQLEKFLTPAAGRMRLDTHTFFVAAQRVFKSYRLWSESVLHGGAAQSLPSFSIASIANPYLDALCTGTFWYTKRTETVVEGEVVVTLAATQMTVSGFRDLFVKVAAEWKSFFRYYSGANGSKFYYGDMWLVHACLRCICAMFSEKDPTTEDTYSLNHTEYYHNKHLFGHHTWDFSSHGNHDDFMQLEGKRLTEYLNAALAVYDLDKDVDEEISLDDAKKLFDSGLFGLGRVVYELLFSIMGEGSTLENLGYPYFSFNSVQLKRISDLFHTRFFTTQSYEEADSDWTIGMKYAAASMGLSPLMWTYIGSEGGNYDTDDSYLEVYFRADELLIRANYAVWYDYFRNYHIEPATSCLNPDTFDTASLFVNGMTGFYNTVELLAPRCRNWSRDMFTMVQPDDVYRHVYAPAASTTLKSSITDLNDSIPYQNADSGLAALFDSVKEGLSNQALDNFPSWAITHFGDNVKSVNTFYHDLQTMRRANMLEKYLQRNYYNPDTYVGQVEARYGIKPVDFAVLVSQYLGGSESMINGKQEVSPVATSETALGQRVLVADASNSDSFTYTAGAAGYLLNYVSIMPLVHYDALNPHLRELTMNDQVTPEYAADNRVMIRACDMLRELPNGADTPLGYVPRYYGYRMSLDSVHGKYLREYRPYTWLRDGVSLSSDSLLTISPINNRVHLPLDCFQGLQPWDAVAFGPIDLNLFIERPLPSKVEFV